MLYLLETALSPLCNSNNSNNNTLTYRTPLHPTLPYPTPPYSTPPYSTLLNPGQLSPRPWAGTWQHCAAWCGWCGCSRRYLCYVVTGPPSTIVVVKVALWWPSYDTVATFGVGSLQSQEETSLRRRLFPTMPPQTSLLSFFRWCSRPAENV